MVSCGGVEVNPDKVAVRLRRALVSLVATRCTTLARKIELSISGRVKISLIAVVFRHYIVFICKPSWSSLCIATLLALATSLPLGMCA